MKTWVEFLDYDLSGKLDTVCGDRGVVFLDGRRNLSGLIADAHDCNGWRRPQYPAFRIVRGECLLRPVRVIYDTQTVAV
jgi:hypothetical protein